MSLFHPTVSAPTEYRFHQGQFSLGRNMIKASTRLQRNGRREAEAAWLGHSFKKIPKTRNRLNRRFNYPGNLQKECSTNEREESLNFLSISFAQVRLGLSPQ